jgi:DNA-binding beta-propeller fold protein YncE
MKFLRLTVFLCSVVVLFHLQSCEPEADPVAAKATHLYFSDFSGKRIGVVDVNAIGSFTTLADAADGLDTISGITVDFLGGKIYATEELNNRIVRVNIDGSGSVEVIYDEDDAVDEPTAVAIDAATNSLYWANSGSGHIKKGSMDGLSAIDTLYDAKVISYCYGLAIDPSTNTLFFSDFGDFSGIWMGTLAGTGSPGKAAFPSFSIQNPAGLYLDKNTYRLYWADEGLAEICTGTVSNQSASIVFDDEDGITQADGIAVDLGSGKIYWTEPDKKTIMRGNIDGTGTPEVIATGVESYSIMLKFDNQ